MIRLSMIWALSRAEARLTRRLVRYWIFVVMATLLAAANYSQFFFIHRMFSWASASAATANPRFFVGNFGSLFLLVFLVGLIFLAFDLRARDKRDRIVEVLDAAPCSNLELVLGKFVGLMLAAWIPVVIVTALLVLVTYLIGTSPQPHSIVGFVLWMALPAYVFTIGLVFCITLLVRYRLLAAIISAVFIIFAFFVSLWWIPFYATAFTDVTGGYALIFPSDVLPGVITFGGAMQRLGFALFGLAFLVFAASIHPRNDDGSRVRRAAAGEFFILLAGFGACAVLFLENRGTVEARENWRAAHEQRSREAAPDLIAVGGSASIRPGKRIDLDLELRFRAPEGSGLEGALFTLNPGLNIESVTDSTGKPLGFTHEDGLLDIELSRALAPGEEDSLALRAGGNPDPDFAYVTAVIEPLALPPVDAQIFVLGFDSLAFQRRYVALPGGVRWLPVGGAEVGRGDPLIRPPDFFDLDLTVELPDGWLAAGPSRRETVPGESGRVSYRFAPPAPLPEVALVASRFESFSTEIEGVELELLIHPAHVENARFFEDATNEIRDWLAERLAEASAVGFDYPYDSLTMVEIPNSLRGFSGGWRMDSALIQPAMILMRESGFPTAYFKHGNSRFERARDEEGGVARAKRNALLAFFENDLNGGNPFIASARSFFGYQTAGSGPEALSLDYVLESLSSELVSERRGFFSVHFFDQDFGQEFMLAGQAMNDPNRVADNYADVLVHRITSTSKVWDTVTGVSLTELDPRDDPERTINVLSLKGGAMAESMLDDLGREKTGRFLAALRNENRGSNYSRDDVVIAGNAIDEELDSWLALWIDETDLPGFSLGPVRYYRLPDDENGAPRYQLRVVVRNGERPDGLIRLEYRNESQSRNSSRQRTDPIKVAGESAIEIGLINSEPIQSVRVAPYLALNRDPFNVSLPNLDEEKIVEEEPFVGNTELAWAPEIGEAIIVDDLDEGFGVSESEERSMFRFAGQGKEDEDLDQGLPISKLGVRNSKWARVTYADAYGRYRHTMAAVRKGEGKKQATFTAQLPKAGAWELDYYVPGWRSSRRSNSEGVERGTWKLVLEDDSGSREIELDADSAEIGWNSIGRFDMASGEVRVRVSDATNGKYVQADAIRWRPASGASTQDAVASARIGTGNTE